MKRSHLRDHSGYSLIQLLVVLALIGFILTAAYGVYFFGVRLYARGNTQAVLQQEARTVDLLLGNELTYAYGVSIYASLDDVELHGDYTLLYSDAQGVWTRNGLQQPRLVMSDDKVIYDLTISADDEFDSLMSIIITISSKKNPALVTNVVKTISLFNSSVDGKGTVIHYRKNL